MIATTHQLTNADSIIINRGLHYESYTVNRPKSGNMRVKDSAPPNTIKIYTLIIGNLDAC